PRGGACAPSAAPRAAAKREETLFQPSTQTDAKARLILVPTRATTLTRLAHVLGRSGDSRIAGGVLFAPAARRWRVGGAPLSADDGFRVGLHGLGGCRGAELVIADPAGRFLVEFGTRPRHVGDGPVAYRG